MSCLRLLGFPVLLGAAAGLIAAPPSRLLAQSPSTREQGVVHEQSDLLGTWRLDLSRSKYVPGPAPRNETRTYARDKEGVKGTIQRQYADGREETIEYRSDFDQEMPVSGTEAYDAITLKRIDARTAEATLSHAGRVFGKARRIISEDGQTLTITLERESPDFTRNVAVYRKENGK